MLKIYFYLKLERVNERDESYITGFFVSQRIIKSGSYWIGPLVRRPFFVLLKFIFNFRGLHHQIMQICIFYKRF